MINKREQQLKWLKDIELKTGFKPSRISKEAGLAATTVLRFIQDTYGNQTLSWSTEKKIADRFGYSEEDSINQHPPNDPKRNMIGSHRERIKIPEYDVLVAAGNGEHIDHEQVENVWEIPRTDLPNISSNPNNLAIIKVVGVSMEPEYHAGEKILVDVGVRTFIGDGVYVLDCGYGLIIKHLQIVLGSTPQIINVISTNTIYPTQQVPIQDVDIKGKVTCKWAAQ